MKGLTILSWILRIGIAIIYLQTLYFKFTAQPEAVHIFAKVGGTPARIGSGVMELIISILILIPATKMIGFLGSFFVIIGAIFMHLFIIGINVQEDGGQLFTLAVIVFLATTTLLIIHSKALKALFGK